MTIVVSISQFRQNIADYISKAQSGHTIILKDEKKGQEIAHVVTPKQFDPDTFSKALEQASGVFTAKNHPEWKTKQDVIRWLRKTRKSSDRTF